MNRAWWGRERLSTPRQDAFNPPELAAETRDEIRRQVSDRRLAFVPEWRLQRVGDPADALLSLHAELSEPVIQRVNRLPDKLYREFLRTAGIGPVPARPARAVLNFTVSDAAPRSVVVPERFQVSAPGAGGTDERVVFETERTLHAAPGEIAMVVVQDGSTFYEIEIDNADAVSDSAAFGADPSAGSAFLIGLSSAIAPSPNIAFAIQLATDGGPPAPSAEGTRSLVDADPQPLLRWSFLDGARFETAEVIRDETRGISQSGIVELRCPRRWRAGTPAGVSSERDLRWIRLQLVAGEFAKTPSVSAVTLNAVSAVAARTVRNEVLEYVPDTDRRRLSVSQRPVLAGTLRLAVNEGTIGTLPGDSAGSAPLIWSEVDNLDAADADAKVFELDAVNGELKFGDGIHGAALPEGFRHVVAEVYQVASGSASSVDADTINSLLSSAPFLTEVSNRLPATGGRDAESIAVTNQRGPQQIRARNRCVTVADYNLLALEVDGANILRAHAVAGVHAGQNDARVPGTVSLYLVGQPGVEGPPYPKQGGLAAVARSLSENFAPAGIEVVAASPYFHQVSIRASLAIAQGADNVRVLDETLKELDRYLDPLVGGNDGMGWPFGGPIIHNLLVQRLMSSVSGLEGITELNLTVDNVTLVSCSDFVPRPNSLPWTVAHELIPEEQRTS